MDLERSELMMISKSEWEQHLIDEGIDPKKACAIFWRWAETAPYTEGVTSSLIRYDLLIRSDGSAVALDCCMSIESLRIGDLHTGQLDIKSNRDFIRHMFPELGLLDVPTGELCRKAQELVGWETYVSRLAKGFLY